MCSTTTRNTRSAKKRTADVYDDMPVALPAAKRPHGSPRAARRILEANKSPSRSSTSRATSSRSSSGTATSATNKKRRASAAVVDYDEDDVPRSTKRSCITDLRDATLDILDRITKGEKKLTSLTKDDLEACIYRCVQDIAIANRKDVRRIAKAYDVSTDDVDKILEPLQTKAKVATIMADDEEEEADISPSPATSNKKRAAATVVDDYDYDYDDDVAPRAGKRICTEEQRIRNLTRDALNISSIHPKDKVDEALARTVKEGVPIANPKDVDVVAEAYDLPRNTVMEKLEDVEDVARNNMMRQERRREASARRPSVRPVAQAAVSSTTQNEEVVDLTDEPKPSPYPVAIGAPRGVIGAFVRVSEDTAIANNADVELLMDYFGIDDSLQLLAFVDRCMALRRELARLRAAAGARAVPKRSFTTSPTGNRTKKPKHKLDLLGNLFFSAAVVNARHQGLNCTTTATLACTFLVGLYRENRRNNKK